MVLEIAIVALLTFNFIQTIGLCYLVSIFHEERKKESKDRVAKEKQEKQEEEDEEDEKAKQEVRDMLEDPPETPSPLPKRRAFLPQAKPIGRPKGG